MNDYFKIMFIRWIDDYEDEEQILTCGNASNLAIALNWWNENGYINITNKIPCKTQNGRIEGKENVYTFYLTELGIASRTLYQL